MHHIIIPITKKPGTAIHVHYNQPLNNPNAPFLVTGMYHYITLPNEGAIVTNMAHLIMDVMTTGYFAALRVQIDHEVEMARRAREGASKCTS